MTKRLSELIKFQPYQGYYLDPSVQDGDIVAHVRYLENRLAAAEAKVAELEQGREKFKAQVADNMWARECAARIDELESVLLTLRLNSENPIKHHIEAVTNRIEQLKGAT